MENTKITRVTIDELKELQSIGKQTFFETFAENNTAENIQQYLEEAFSLERLENECKSEDSEFYFVWWHTKIVGYLKLNTGMSQTELKDEKAIEIERIYVLKEFHGKKIGQIVYDWAHTIALQKNANYIWLGVWEKNERAIRFYEKNGFVAFDQHIFRVGEEEQTDLMMKKVLR